MNNSSILSSFDYSILLLLFYFVISYRSSLPVPTLQVKLYHRNVYVQDTALCIAHSMYQAPIGSIPRA